MLFVLGGNKLILQDGQWFQLVPVVMGYWTKCLALYGAITMERISSYYLCIPGKLVDTGV